MRATILLTTALILLSGCAENQSVVVWQHPNGGQTFQQDSSGCLYEANVKFVGNYFQRTVVYEQCMYSMGYYKTVIQRQPASPNSALKQQGVRVKCPKCSAVFMDYEGRSQYGEDKVQCPRCQAVFTRETGIEELNKKGY